MLNRLDAFEKRRVLGFGLSISRNVRIGIFPQVEDVLVESASRRAITIFTVGASDDESRPASAMTQCGGGFVSHECREQQAAAITSRRLSA